MTLSSLNARTGETLGAALTPSTAQAAHAAGGDWAASSGAQRAALLQALPARSKPCANNSCPWPIWKSPSVPCS